MPPKTAMKKIIKKAVGRALGIGLLLVLSYGVIGRRPHTATWFCLGAALLAYAVYTAWWDVNSKKPRLP